MIKNVNPEIPMEKATGIPKNKSTIKIPTA
jgi:hypothetical protein